MTSFGWKRKLGERVNVKASAAFEKDIKEEDTDCDDVDWMTLMPKRRAISLEDAVIKAQRLKQEGMILAEADRYWEAIKKWDEALQLNVNNAKIFEMKAQAYAQVGELFPSLHAAQKAVELDPQWWVAYQTLARSQLGLGEVSLAARNICKAFHLNPGERDILEEDIPWVMSLLQQKRLSKQMKAHAEQQKQDSVKVVELDTKDQCTELIPRQAEVASTSSILSDVTWEDEHSERTLKMLPKNYVYLRD